MILTDTHVRMYEGLALLAALSKGSFRPSCLDLESSEGFRCQVQGRRPGVILNRLRIERRAHIITLLNAGCGIQHAMRIRRSHARKCGRFGFNFGYVTVCVCVCMYVYIYICVCIYIIYVVRSMLVY